MPQSKRPKVDKARYESKTQKTYIHVVASTTLVSFVFGEPS